MSFPCTVAGCDFEGATKGALTQHVNKNHAADPLAKAMAGVPGAPRPGGVFNDKPLRAAPSGIPSVDYAIGIGGIPRGAIAEIFGPSQSGKTFTALTFSAYAQQQGELAAYMNAEKAPMQTFLPLIPGLDVPGLLYGEPPVADKDASKADRELWDGTGEAILESARRSIRSGAIGVYTIDSVHSLIARQAIGLPIGSAAALAALARMLGAAVPILEHEINVTNTLLIFVNHVKSIPGQSYGRDWSKPGGSALDYYASIQLHVTTGKPYYRQGDDRRIGHVVKVRVHKNKVALPHAKAEYDLFYGAGRTKPDENNPARDVVPGVDVVSSWLSVLKESKTIAWVGNKWVDIQGEVIGGGTEGDVREALCDPGSSLMAMAREVVYPEQYVTA
jgi:recombination protein RecA